MVETEPETRLKKIMAYTLYKYRSIDNFKFFVDIIINERLYAAPYQDLNDPMEGHYLYRKGEIDTEWLELISNQKNNVRICALSETPASMLMWSHYSDSHKGVCIEVEVSLKDYDIRQMHYGSLRMINECNLNNGVGKDILSCKLPPWKYEKEWRVFVENENYVHVKVKSVLIGEKMSNQDFSIIKKMVSHINPKIKVKRFNGEYL